MLPPFLSGAYISATSREINKNHSKDLSLISSKNEFCNIQEKYQIPTFFCIFLK
jgi:hypothetical protein